MSEQFMDGAAVASEKSGGVLKWIAGGCCGCLLLLIGFFALAGGGAYFATKGAADAAHAHVRLVKAGKLQEAYDATATAFKQTVTFAEFQQFVTAYPQLYQGSDLTLSSRHTRNGEAQMSGTTIGADGKSTPVTFSLDDEGDAWRVKGVHLVTGDAAPVGGGEATPVEEPEEPAAGAPPAGE